jgi:hypothetical protein
MVGKGVQDDAKGRATNAGSMPMVIGGQKMGQTHATATLALVAKHGSE